MSRGYSLGAVCGLLIEVAALAAEHEGTRRMGLLALPGPGIELVSPGLAGRFLPTVPLENLRALL